MGNNDESDSSMLQDAGGFVPIKLWPYKGREVYLHISFSWGGTGEHLTSAALCEMATDGFYHLDLQEWIGRKFDAGEGDRQEVLLNQTEWRFVFSGNKIQVHASGPAIAQKVSENHKLCRELYGFVLSWRKELLAMWEQRRPELVPDHMVTSWDD